MDSRETPQILQEPLEFQARITTDFFALLIESLTFSRSMTYVLLVVRQSHFFILTGSQPTTCACHKGHGPTNPKSI